jgi:hypothetical protein
MEVAVMSLSAREQQALDSIENGLSGTDPKLALLLATFARLTAGEEMPVPEKIRAEGRRATRIQRRRHRDRVRRHALRPRQRLGRRQVWLLLLITVVMIAVALAIR